MGHEIKFHEIKIHVFQEIDSQKRLKNSFNLMIQVVTTNFFRISKV